LLCDAGLANSCRGSPCFSGLGAMLQSTRLVVETMSHPAQFDAVSIVTKANVYFDGKVVSHTVLFGDHSRKTLGLIYAGTYHFGTNAPERMDIIAGRCSVVLDGEERSTRYGEGETFRVPGNSGFTITVAEGIAEYLCTFET
jgi:purine/pyrimidine-nucleoside phosphorylase